MNYKLPEPVPCGYIAGTEYFYTADQMQAAHAAGRASRDAEVEALNAKLTYANEVIDQRNAEIKRGHEDFIQAVTDPENQPSQFGTVTLAMYESIRVDRDGLHKAWESAFGDRSFEEVQSEVEALRADAEKWREHTAPKIVGWMNPCNGVVISPSKKLTRSIGHGYPNFSVPVYAARAAQEK